MVKYFNFNVKNMKENGPFTKSDFDICSVSTVNNPMNNTVIFCNKQLEVEQLNKLRNIKECLLILNENDNDNDKVTSSMLDNYIIYDANPRKKYAQVLQYIINSSSIDKKTYKFKNDCYIGENVSFGSNLKIEPFVTIGNNVSVGNNCTIKAGVRIKDNTIIGDNCVLKDNCVIGSDGFGMERDADGTTYRIPHLGGVIIGNNVEIGALVSIAQGTIEPTIIEDYVKIDDCVFVAHNCKIGKGTFLIANSEISGSVTIGEKCWIGPNTTIINGVSLGDNVMTGIGAVVTKSIESGLTVAGNPADKIENIKKIRAYQKELLK